MSTAASNGKTAPSIATGGRVNPGSVDKPAAKPGPKGKPPMTPEQKKHVIVIGVALAVVLVTGAAIFAYFNTRNADRTPRINAPIDQMVPFISTNEFDKLEFDRKKLYWKELADKKKELDEMHKTGKISDKQYADVLAVVWLGKQFKHIEKYNALGELDKRDYLDKIIDENIENGPKVKGVIEKDQKRVDALKETFPEHERKQIDAFRQALKEREKQRHREDQEIKKKAAAAARAAATRPTSRPAEKPPAVETVVKPAVKPVK